MFERVEFVLTASELFIVFFQNEFMGRNSVLEQNVMSVQKQPWHEPFTQATKGH
jgi:hypothetical protein